jgi:hypothetical protein
VYVVSHCLPLIHFNPYLGITAADSTPAWVIYFGKETDYVAQSAGLGSGVTLGRNMECLYHNPGFSCFQ